MKRLDSALITGVGVLVVHQIGYAISAALGAEADIGHGHLAVAWLIASLAAVGALAKTITESLRSRHHDPLSLGFLTLLLSTGFVGLEATERWMNGSSPAALLGEAVFWLGLAASPVVALALRWSVRVAADAACVLLNAFGTQTWPQHAPTTLGHTSLLLTSLSCRSHTVSRRGPPTW